jgi:ribose transport system permease protein
VKGAMLSQALQTPCWSRRPPPLLLRYSLARVARLRLAQPFRAAGRPVGRPEGLRDQWPPLISQCLQAELLIMMPSPSPTNARLVARATAMPGVGYLLTALLATFSLLDPSFASVRNVLNIGTQTSILLLLALPMTLIIMSEGLDLSMGAVLGLAGVVLAMVLAQGGSVLTGLAAAVGVGLAFGFANGLLVVTFGIPPFVATLATLGVAQGFAVSISGGQSVVGIGETLPALYASTVAGLPFSVVIAVLTYVAFHVLLYSTSFGTYVFAIGGNREALTLAGVRTNLYHAAIYVLGGLMAGFAALLLTGRMNAGHPIAAIGMEFDAIAAVIVGGTSFERGNGWLPGSLLGVLAVGVLRNGLNLMAVSSSLQVASIGLLVVAALVIDSLRASIRGRQ